VRHHLDAWDRHVSAYATGTNGRWLGVLIDEQVERCLAVVAHDLPAGAGHWLEHGSLEHGSLEHGSLELAAGPAEIGLDPDEATSSRPSGSPWHPVFSRIGSERPANSIDAIAERRAEQARQSGLFDDLSLHGIPISVIDRRQQPGCWANQFVAK
jgi:hypothetical protein